MNLTLQNFIQFAGLLQLIIAGANFFAPAKLHYRENLAKLSPIFRQIFIVHSVYIVIVLIGFGLLSLLFPGDLCGTSDLGKFLCALLALFWGLRVVLQFAYYDRQIKKENPWGTALFGSAFLLLAAIYGFTTFRVL